MKKKYFKPSYYSSISRWFLSIWGIILIIFFIALIPIFLYLNNTFSSLQQERINQKLYTGSTQLELLVEGLHNTSQTLSEDPRFIPLRYVESDYGSIPANVLNQMKNLFRGLTIQLTPVTDAVLQLDLDQNIVITNHSIFFQDKQYFYPNFFCVNDMDSTEWELTLSENNSGFLPIHHIKKGVTGYDALIYSTKWSSDSYLYVCMNIDDIRELLLTDSSQEGYYITLSTLGGEVLYSDLPEDLKDYQTLSNRTSKGQLEINIHIDNAVFYQKMHPMYLFISIYCIISIISMILAILAGIRFSTQPILNIISLLEGSKNIPAPDIAATRQGNIRNSPDGFHFISQSILKADTNLGEYQNTINTQKKVLQARFLEKALNGQLMNPKDIQQFYSCFPDFPKSYCLTLFRLWSYEKETTTLYTEPLQLLATFLKDRLPGVYQQQLNSTDLLLVISDSDFENYLQILDFTVKNINQEEPSYFVRGVSSHIYHHLESLPVAYHQLQDMCEFSFPDEQMRVCTVSDCPEMDKLPLTMTDLIALYTAITYGNRKMAISKLRTYSDEIALAQNSSLSRHAYEMIRSILTCIKLEHPLQLIDLHIPSYRSTVNLFIQLEELIGTICDLINSENKPEVDPFAKEILQYIDANYMDCDLYLTTLEAHFKCSSSTIRKAFKNATNMTVTSYIEQKRMARANELLAQNQLTIADIATKCGFTNTNSFYKAYRRVHGHAPTMQK